MPPSRTTRPSGRVTSSVPRRSFEPKPSASRTRRGRSASTLLDIVGGYGDQVRHGRSINDVALCPAPRTVRASLRPSLDQSAPPRAGQRRSSISAAFAARQAVLRGAIRRLRYRGRGTNARALEPEPQRFPMDRGDDLEGDKRQREERPQQRRRGQGAAAAWKVAASSGPSRSVSRMRNLTSSPGGEIRKW